MTLGLSLDLETTREEQVKTLFSAYTDRYQARRYHKLYLGRQTAADAAIVQRFPNGSSGSLGGGRSGGFITVMGLPLRHLTRPDSGNKSSRSKV